MMKLLTMRNILLSLLIVGIPLFVYTGCKIPDSSEQSNEFSLTDAQNRKSTILKIGDTLYSNSDFEKYVRATLGEDQEALTVVSLSRLFDNFVDERILLHAARAQNMVLTEKEKEDYLAKLSGELSTEDRDVSLNEGDRDFLFERLLIEKYTYELVRTIEVQEEEIKAYYELHRRDFLRPERVKVSQILLETESKAVEVLETVKNANEEGFRKMVREESVGLEALKGGEMGVFEMGQLPFEMEKVIFSLQEGELSSVVKTSYGYHIFRVDKRFDPELISEEEASSSIRTKLLNQKIEERISRHLEDLKLSVDWSFYPLNLPFPYQRIDI
jgi:hypothetical protein